MSGTGKEGGRRARRVKGTRRRARSGSRANCMPLLRGGKTGAPLQRREGGRAHQDGAAVAAPTSGAGVHPRGATADDGSAKRWRVRVEEGRRAQRQSGRGNGYRPSRAIKKKKSRREKREATAPCGQPPPGGGQRVPPRWPPRANAGRPSPRRPVQVPCMSPSAHRVAPTTQWKTPRTRRGRVRGSGVYHRQGWKWKAGDGSPIDDTATSSAAAGVIHGGGGGGRLGDPVPWGSGQAGGNRMKIRGRGRGGKRRKNRQSGWVGGMKWPGRGGPRPV